MSEELPRTGLSPAEMKVVLDVIDILSAARLCFVMAVGPPGSQRGGVFTNMPTETAQGALMWAFTKTVSVPIDVPRGTVQ